jgi:hypothetical protein
MTSGSDDRRAAMTTDLRDELDASFGAGPPPPPVEGHLAAGRRVVRRRRRTITVSAIAVLAVAAFGPVLLRPVTGTGGGGGGGGHHTPPPAPTTTAPPTPVHLLVAPPKDVTADSPPVVYLSGRMFKRDRNVTVLGAFGDVDLAQHPRGAVIVRVGGVTSWVVVVGNEPERLTQQRTAPYDYNGLMAWALPKFSALSGHLALAVTAPGPYAPPVLDAGSPGVFEGGVLVAKPGGTVVQRDRHPVHNPEAVRACDAQAARIHTGGGDWFVLGDDCPGGLGALYSERVDVRADTLSSWLVQVKRAQNAYVR